MCLKKRAIEGSRDEMAAAAEILECIALPGIRWTPTADNRPKCIKLGDLKVPVRLWYHLVVSTIMPSINHTEVGLPRGILLWAIMTGGRVDLPQILADSLFEIAQEASPKASVGHSSLIQYLCQAAGVEIPPPEQRKVPTFPVMNKTWITKKWRDLVRAEEQPDQPAEEQAAADQPHPPREGGGHRPGPSRTLGTRMTALETEVRLMREQQTQEFDRLHYEYERQHAFQECISAQMAFLCRDYPDAPPTFQPPLYAEPTAHAPPAAEDQDGDHAADTPEFVHDAEDEEMDG